MKQIKILHDKGFTPQERSVAKIFLAKQCLLLILDVVPQAKLEPTKKAGLFPGLDEKARKVQLDDICKASPPITEEAAETCRAFLVSEEASYLVSFYRGKLEL